ncbi:MAG: DUF5058 family protein [Clostridia bacterium]|nr:DUF5058 family protein [Clostridia bacterium]
MDFKENGFFTAVGAIVILVILGQSVFFLVKAWKRGKEIGITASTMKNTVISSVLFTVAPAFAIVATVLALSNALGLVVPWIRLSVIGNISQETTAASAALETVGGSLASKVEDPYAFGLITWVMTLGSALPLILLPLFLKKLQFGVHKAAGKGDPKLVDALAAAAFIGLIAAFIARAIAGKGAGGDNPLYGKQFGDGAGVMSVACLATSIVVMLILQRIATKKNIRWLETFAMPISMFAAMGVAIIMAIALPENIAFLEWRG